MSEEIKQFYEFTPDDSREKIIAHLKARLKTVIGSEARTAVEGDFVANYLTELLKLKNQEHLLQSQNNFNKEMLSKQEEMIEKQKELVKATWALVIVTIIVTIATLLNNLPL